MSELLKMEGICKSFPGVKALDGVSLSVKAGTVHALMGENGAGKSTLMKCLFGVYECDEGKIFLDGKEVRFASSREALDGGVAMVHQELNQALKLSVGDNIWLGRFPTVSRFLPFTSERKIKEKTLALFSELGISIDPDMRVSELSVSKRQMLEIAKAVSFGAKIIVFDEPTSSLADDEAKKLFEIIRMLKERGCGIIYISHKMAEILQISDVVTVMRDGKHIATRAASELTTDEIIRLMVGRELGGRFPEKRRKIGNVKLVVKGLAAKDGAPKEVDFSLREGEILGIAGLDGSGRTELVETLFGLRERSGGEIVLDGRSVKNRTPRESIQEGFALLTEERRRDGIFSILSIKENTTVSSLKRYARGPIIDSSRIRRDTERSIKMLKIKTPSAETKIRTLSGGNQQKVILARWLLTEPQVLLLDEPTRGIDVGAKYEIYEILESLTEQGKSIIVVSSEMEELIGISDRILVMSGGRAAGILVTKEATQEKIMELAAKHV